MQFLAISGSLRAQSINTILLRALAKLAPEGINVNLFDNMGGLPHFNPDLDIEGAVPIAISDFRARLQSCDAVIICSPEYAHGMPGVMKNALDWVVSSGELMNKPIAVIGPSGRATFARAQLEEVLRTIMAEIVESASVSIPLGGHRIDEEAILNDAEIVPILQRGLDELGHAVRS